MTDTPAANQHKTEQFPASHHADPARSAPPAPAPSDPQLPTGPPGAQPVPSPGAAAGVSVPSVQAARGTSEEGTSELRRTALAPPGRPDGEVDTRP